MWEVDSFSDHNFIRCEIVLENEVKESRRNPRKTDWDLFKYIFRSKVSSICTKAISTEVELDKKVMAVSKALTSSFEIACPLPGKSRRQNRPWWNKDIATTIRDVNKKWNRCKKVDTADPNYSELWNEYKEGKRQLCYKIRKAKKESWKSYCETMDDSQEASRLRRILAKESNYPSFIGKRDGKWAETDKAVIETLMDTHFPDSKKIEEEVIESTPCKLPKKGIAEKVITEEKMGDKII